MKSSNLAVTNPSDSNYFVNKAEIERRRRARMNASLDQLKMFHLTRSPTIESKMEKIEILDLTIKYLRSIGNDQSKEAEKMAYLGFRNGFQEAQKATTSFIYSQYHPSISSPLVASINAQFASVFDQSFKSMIWLRSVYGNNVKGRKQFSSTNTSEMNLPEVKQQSNLPEVKRQSTNFLPQSHSTPIFHPKTIPPLFESPESNQSLSLSFSLSSSSSSAKESEEILKESSRISNGVEFVCVTCEGNCCCNKK